MGRKFHMAGMARAQAWRPDRARYAPDKVRSPAGQSREFSNRDLSHGKGRFRPGEGKGRLYLSI